MVADDPRFPPPGYLPGERRMENNKINNGYWNGIKWTWPDEKGDDRKGKMNLSDAEIEHILDKLEVALQLNKISVGTTTSVITTLRSLITEPGLLEDVCPKCLGTGFKSDNDDQWGGSWVMKCGICGQVVDELGECSKCSKLL